jgi:hypothetical protein
MISSSSAPVIFADAAFPTTVSCGWAEPGGEGWTTSSCLLSYLVWNSAMLVRNVRSSQSAFNPTSNASTVSGK